MLVAATLPLAIGRRPGGAALSLRSRYDVRSMLLTISMALRLAGIAIGAQYGLTETIAGIAIAQASSTAIVAAGARPASAGSRALRRNGLQDRRELVSFVMQSSSGSGVLSLRGALAPLILGVVTNTTQLGYFRVAQAPQQAFNALSAPVRMVLLTEQTRDWERGRQSHVLRGIRQYTVLAGALMAILVPLLLWLMPDLVRLVYGSEFLPATDAAPLSCSRPRSCSQSAGRSLSRSRSAGRTCGSIHTASRRSSCCRSPPCWVRCTARRARRSRCSSRPVPPSSSSRACVGRHAAGSGRRARSCRGRGDRGARCESARRIWDLAARRRRPREPRARLCGLPRRARLGGPGRDDCVRAARAAGLPGALDLASASEGGVARARRSRDREARREADVVYTTGMFGRSASGAHAARRPYVVKLTSDPAFERARRRGDRRGARRLPAWRRRRAGGALPACARLGAARRRARRVSELVAAGGRGELGRRPASDHGAAKPDAVRQALFVHATSFSASSP